MRSGPTDDSPFARALHANAPLILDGGLATELEARGHDLSGELWSARLLRDGRDAILSVHRDFIAAGADVIISASYQATLDGFRRRLRVSEDDAVALLASALDLAKEARNGRRDVFVAASVGPYGAALADGSEYRGDYGLDEDSLMHWHRRRFQILAGGGADVLAFETIPSLDEARALLRLLDETESPGAWLSFSCRDAENLSDGTPFRDAVDAVKGHPKLLALGINCTAPENVENLLLTARTRTALPLVSYPNSGEVWDAAERCFHGTSDLDEFVTIAPRWRDAGARLIGGCCRTGPEHVRRLRARLSEERSSAAPDSPNAP